MGRWWLVSLGSMGLAGCQDVKYDPHLGEGDQDIDTDSDSDTDTDTDTDGDTDTDTDSDTDGDTDTDSDTDTDTDTDVPAYCAKAALLPAPLEYTLEGSYSTAEDFTFDPIKGYHVALNNQNHLLAQDIDETYDDIIATNVVSCGAGTQALSDGSFAVNDACSNSLVRVFADGTKDTLLSGFSYPNGLEVGPDDFLYVAENGGYRVRRVDPDTGDYTVIAENVPGANGIAFGPGFTTLYVGSFGGGDITAIPRGETFDSWGPHYKYTNVTHFPATSPCDGLTEGATCLAAEAGEGTCTSAGYDFLRCKFTPDVDGCSGKSVGDECSTTLRGVTVTSQCVSTADETMTYCTRAEPEALEACVGIDEGRNCTLASGTEGKCRLHYEAVLVCQTQEDGQLMIDACSGKASSDACEANLTIGPYAGVCDDITGYLGVNDFGCKPSWLESSGGGGALDALNVDECGNVYASDYSNMDIYRAFPDGTGEVTIDHLPSYWIPNMKWAPTIGGWSETVLYIADRSSGGLFTMETGVKGKHVTAVK